MWLSKSRWGELPVEDIPNFTCICVYLCIYLYMYFCHASWPNQKRYRPVIQYTYSHWPYLKRFFFCFFEEMTQRAASLEKLACHGDFLHISSIAFFIYLFICVTLPGKTKNITDLKLGTHTPLAHIWKCFFGKTILRTATLKKLPHHVDFPHIYSIALCFFAAL